MSIAEKTAEIKNLIQLLITIIPEIVALIKEIVVCIKEIQSV